MNYRMIFYTLGNILKAEALLMLLPCAVSLIYGEASIRYFLFTIAILLVIGFSISLKKPKNSIIYAREGFTAVALSWITVSLFGALPFFLSGQIPSYVDAFFETVSGFTTTGSTILLDIESLDRGILFWRSFTHWIGGMGILVFVLAIIPLADQRSMHIMRAEVPGPTVSKLVPKIRTTAKILYGIYAGLTLIQIIFYLCGGMPLYDSIVTSFATAGTGGFSVKNMSIAAYASPYIEWVTTIFMMLFGINFNFFYLILIRQFADAFRMEEVAWYIGIILVSAIAICLNIQSMFGTTSEAFRHASFQVSSIITTTGFITVDFSLWPEFSRTILILLMVIGACSGSTGGGIKVSRFILLSKSALQEARHMLHPRAVRCVRLEGKPVSTETLSGIAYFFIWYMGIFFVSFLLISLDNFGTETSFVSVLTTLNNVGPGMGVIGATGNFAGYSALSKLVLCFDMLAGRLEIFPMIMLLAPSVWRKNRNTLKKAA